MSTSTAELAPYIEGLELAVPTPEISQLLAGSSFEARPMSVAAADAPSASIDKGSLVSFVAGISPMHQSDALNSTLLAQLNSDKLFNRFDPEEVIPWYRNYAKVLGKVGWDLQDFQFQNYQASGSTFLIDEAIAEIVATFLSPGEVLVVKAALNALSNLQGDDPWYKIWETSSHSTDGGNFQICPCEDEGGKGPLVMGFSAYAFTTTETTTRFLWVSYHSSDTKLRYAKQAATLDEDIYSQVRQQIIEKLGENAKTFIGELEI